MRFRLTVPEIGVAEIEAVAAVLRSGFLVQGDQVRRFEQQVAGYAGCHHGIAVSSGTAALHLALLALGVGDGDEVIVPDYTFPATANVVELCGAIPVLVDIDPNTFNMDIASATGAVTPRTKAIMPVHLFGQPADMGQVLQLARRYGLYVVEDAACALGAEYRGRRCGALGHAGCFSFHPRKAITTGEGGMIVTDDDALAERLRLLRNHGMSSTGGKTTFQAAGFNYRLTEFQGALGVVQMGRLEAILGRRQELAEVYDRELARVPGVIRPAIMNGARHIWQSYVIRLPRPGLRDAVQQALARSGVETTIGTYAVSAQPHYARLGHDLAGSHEAFRQALALPLHGRMTVADIGQVVQELAEVVGEQTAGAA